MTNGRKIWKEAVITSIEIPYVFFSDKAEANHEAVRQYSFPFSQEFERKIKALIPIAPPTRLVIRYSFPNNLVLHFKRLCMQSAFVLC